MNRGAIYIRVSTNDQTEYSPDAQRKALLEYASKNKIYIDREHIYVDEGISGRDADKRPSFQRMIGHAKRQPRPFDYILVHKYDRFARNREDSVVYKSLLRRECGIRVISITETIEDDKFSIILESMLEAMAEYYSINLADEVKKGMLEKAKRGGLQQRPPYGYDILNNDAVVHKEEGAAVKLIFHKYVKEDYTYIEIANFLNSLGYRTKENQPFQSKGIKYILSNEFYTGYVTWNKKNKDGTLKDEEQWIREKGDFEPLISLELYNKAQEKMALRKKVGKPKSNPTSMYKHYFSGLLVCKYCQGKLTLRSYKNGQYKYFRCRKGVDGGCHCKKLIRLENLERGILNTLDKDIQFAPLVLSFSKNNSLEDERLKKEIKKINRKQELAKKAYLAEIDTLEDYKTNKEEWLKEKQKLEHKIMLLHSKSDQWNTLEQNRTYYKLSQIMEDTHIPLEKKNKILSSFINKIIIDIPNEEITLNYNYPPIP